MKSYLTTLSNANKNNNKILLLLIDLDKNNKSFSIIIPKFIRNALLVGWEIGVPLLESNIKYVTYIHIIHLEPRFSTSRESCLLFVHHSLPPG